MNVAAKSLLHYNRSRLNYLQKMAIRIVITNVES